MISRRSVTMPASDTQDLAAKVKAAIKSR